MENKVYDQSKINRRHTFHELSMDFTDSSEAHLATQAHWDTSGDPLEQPTGLVIRFIFKRLVGGQNKEGYNCTLTLGGVRRMTDISRAV